MRTLLRAPGLVGRSSQCRGEGGTTTKILFLGALTWAAYSTLNLFINGIVLDQVVEPAQVITGAVSYPAGHPHYVFSVKAFSLMNYLAAAMWSALPSSLVISAIRNFLFLFLSTFVPFAFTLLLTGKPMWSHLASVVVLTEAAVRFKGVYPLFVFPHIYSDGHIGFHVALLTLVILLFRQWCIGGFLLGLLPSLHIAMAAVLWPWSLVYLTFVRKRLSGREGLGLVVAVLAGLAVCGALAAVIHLNSAAVAENGTYGLRQGDTDLIRENFISLTDGHRQPFEIASFAYLINPLVFFSLCALLWSRLRKGQVVVSTSCIRSDLAWIALFAGISWATIYGAYCIQLISGSLPHYLNVLMPYRFSNFSALLLVPLTMAALAHTHKTLGEKAKFVSILMITGLILLTGIWMMIDRYRVFNYFMLIAWGLLFALDLFARERLRARTHVLLMIAGVSAVAMLSWKHGIAFAVSFVLSSMILTTVTRLPILRSTDWHLWKPQLRLALLGACVITAFTAIYESKVWNQWNGIYSQSGKHLGSWGMLSQPDRKLNEWLAENADPQEMILPAILPKSELQVKTGHPVLFEHKTLWMMTYMPDLAAPVGILAKDLYGVDYSRIDQLEPFLKDGYLGLDNPVWLAAWKGRNTEGWQLLGHKYRFRLVLSPAGTRLALPVALKGPVWTLYSIP